MASPLEVLLNAQTSLVDGGICRFAYARDINEHIVSTHSIKAVTFCPVGAAARACLILNGNFDVLEDTFGLFAPYMEAGEINAWSDIATDIEIYAIVRAVLNIERYRLDHLMV